MITEHGSTSEIVIDKNLLSKILNSPIFLKKIKRGINIIKNEGEESAFSVGIESNGNIVFSPQVTGETKVIFKDLDDYAMNGALISASVDLRKVKFKVTGLTELAAFHFHPNSNTTPSSGDADALIWRLHTRRSDGNSSHKRLFGGIFAVKGGNLSCLFYGLGKQGLVSNYYQAWDSLNNASRFKEAMQKSGFWISEGWAKRKNGELDWNVKLINDVAKNLEG
jgi:hypothetical protein